MERLLDIIVIRKDEITSAAEKKLCDSLIESYRKKKAYEVNESDQKITVYRIIKE